MRFTIDKDGVIGHLGFDQLQISTNEKVGFRPFELFVSSLIGCSGMLLEKILVKKRHAYKNIEMEVSAVRNPDQANRIEQITIIAYVQSEKIISPQQGEQLAALVVRNCGMIQSVIESIDITFTIKHSTPNDD